MHGVSIGGSGVRNGPIPFALARGLIYARREKGDSAKKRKKKGGKSELFVVVTGIRYIYFTISPLMIPYHAG